MPAARRKKAPVEQPVLKFDAPGPAPVESELFAEMWRAADEGVRACADALDWCGFPALAAEVRSMPSVRDMPDTWWRARSRDIKAAIFEESRALMEQASALSEDADRIPYLLAVREAHSARFDRANFVVGCLLDIAPTWAWTTKSPPPNLTPEQVAKIAIRATKP